MSQQVEPVGRHGQADDRRDRGDRAEGRAGHPYGRADGHRDPPVLRPPAARAGRRLPAVPGRRGGPAQAGRLVHADGGRRHGRQDAPDLAGGREGAGRRHGTAADEPPARLPDVRQGRRVPAAEPGDVDRPHRLPLPRAEAHVREADQHLVAGAARPRALRPLPALHPVLRGDRRRQVHRPDGALVGGADRRLP